MIGSVDTFDLIENIRHVKINVDRILFNVFSKHMYLSKMGF